MVLRIAKILNCNYKALSKYDFDAAEDIIETFFWLEGTGNASIIKLFLMKPVQKDEDVKLTYQLAHLLQLLLNMDCQMNSYKNGI